MSNLPKLPDLGNFYGDTGGGPNLALPQTDSFPRCNFLDKEQGEFCALDGNLCPFVGFNYRRCKKYLNNMAKATSQPDTGSPIPMGSNQGPRAGTSGSPQRHPRIESLIEAAKKGGSKKPVKKKRKIVKGSEYQTSYQKAQDKKRDDELEQMLNGDPKLLASMKAWNNTIKQFPPSANPENVAEIVHSHQSTQDILDYAEANFGDLKKEKQLGIMANLYAVFTKRKLGGRVADARAGALQRFSKNVFIAASLDLDPANAPEANRESKYQAHADAREAGDKDAVSISGMDVDDEPEGGRPTPVTQGSTKKTKYSIHHTSPVGKLSQRYKKLKYSHRAGAGRRGFTGRFKDEPQYTQPTEKAKKAVKKAAEKAEKKKNPPTPRRGMTQAGRMDPDQFANFVEREIEPLPDSMKKHMFPGIKRGEYKNYLEELKELARESGVTKNYRQIAHLADDMADKKKWAETFEQREYRFKQEWNQNLRMLKSVPIGDRKAVEAAMRASKNPKNLGLLAKVMNKVTGRVYDLRTKNIKIGNSELAMLYREATLPTFTKQQFEVMRMAEQAGLKAIQKQHQYGRGYGRWNTMVTFFKDILIPYLLWRSDNEKYIIPIMTWPSIQKFTDQLYMAFIQSPLPKFKGKSPLQMSRDDKFLGSEKAHSPVTGKRLMKGWQADDLLPPDKAVLHQRWYPTTKKTWGKTRHKELSKRWQQAKAAPVKQDDWMGGYW